VLHYYNHDKFSSDSAELFVTDYTTNEWLRDYDKAVDTSWNGPWGQRVFQITVWGEANLEVCEKLFANETHGQGTIVRINNVRPKEDRHGLLEGSVYKDEKYPDRPDIHKLSLKKDVSCKPWIGKLKQCVPVSSCTRRRR
jgi:hypothetical protein